MEQIHGGWIDVPENLKSMAALRKRGLQPLGDAKAKIWNSYRWVNLYDISDTTPRKSPTEKQLTAVKKASETRRNLKTCKCCGNLYTKNDLKEGICEWCEE